MSERHDAARAALEAALAATSSTTTSSTAAPSSATRSATPSDASAADADAGPRAAREGRRRRRHSAPADPEKDLQSRDDEPDPYDVARQIVLRQLAMAPRSRQQLRDKLRKRNCPDEVAEAVLDRMTEVGLVDDEAFAGMLVRSQQVGRGLATRALARELRTKGVDPDTAEAALADIDPEDERERARALVEKKLRTMHGLDATVQTRRLAGMLARKGYDSSMAFGVIRDALAEAPEHRRD